MNDLTGFRERFFEVAVRNGAYTSPLRLRRHLDYIFNGTPLRGTNVLDIGGGTGLLTLWAAVEGATATCLEPESAGATQSVRKVFERMKTEISSELPASMSSDAAQEYLSTSKQKFHVIVMANSINHIAEADCAKLLSNEESRRTYLAFFQQVKSHLTPGGQLIVTDCDRRNFFGDIGLTSPLMPSINWSIHQSPGTWARLMEQAGLSVFSIKWTTPNTLGSLGQILLGNRVSAYFMFSHFRIGASAPPICTSSIERT